MFLDQLPYMLQTESGLIFDFFNNKEYVSLSSDEAMRVYWPNDLEEYTFASHTSLINPLVILQVFLDNNIIH